MTFGAPHLLWLLLVLPPALIVFFWWSWRRRQQLMTLFIQARLLPALTRGVSPLRQKVRLACLVAAVVCVIVALAQPQWGFSWREVKQRGVDIVVAIDCSKSMLARDIAPNRLGRAKLAALELMQKARTDRLGLVAFAGSAFLQCPLTIDDAAFGQSVDSLDVNTVSQGGTALAEAIDTALTAFKEGENHRVLVLMTDGEDHDSGALEAAQKAARAGMRIYTIGIGTSEGELVRIKDPQGREEFVRDEDGNVVKSRLNEDLLKQIATATEGGFYLPLRGAKTVDTLYEKGLAELPKSEHQEKLVKQYHQRFHWPLGAAIVLLMIEMLIPQRRRGTRHRHASANQPVGSKPAAAPAAVLLLLVCAMAPRAFGASTGKALRDYKDGNYDQAFKEYEQLLERKADDPRLHFNAGTAAYRNRQFDQAKKQFNDALASPDLKLQERAYYNRGNSLYYLGEQTPDPKKRTEAWEQALKDFDLSAKLNPQDADAKFNHEFVKRKLEELKQQQQQKNQPDDLKPSEAAKKAKADADEAVRRREYSRAHEIMERQLANDPTTAFYGDYIQRLKEVNGVQEAVKH
ncbi:MAG TPA: VWA domain-containing protein [Verrucomicrobiae bacterium]